MLFLLADSLLRHWKFDTEMNQDQNKTSNEEQVENPEINNVQETQAESVVQVEETPENVEEVAAEPTPEPTIEDELKEVQGKFVRLYADFENYRKRTNKEKVDLLSSASAGVVKDMLTILDDFDRAIANNEKVDDVKALKEGFGLIHNKFKSILESKGLKPMTAKGEAFDSEIHEAVANMPIEDEKMKGKVIDDVEKGYYLNEKVIRFAKVVVGQ